MKILVTGGAGFIGSHLTDRLLAENNQVVALDNLSLGRKSNLKQASENPNFTFIEEDILHEDALNRIFAEHRFDMVFHLAANSDIARSFANPDVDLDMTFMTTYILLKTMKKHNVKKLMFASMAKPVVLRSEKTTARCFRLLTTGRANWPVRLLSPVLPKITASRLGLPAFRMFAEKEPHTAFCTTLSKS
mgnify:CR=1 FL=1